jgi:hypothetical protein
MNYQVYFLECISIIICFNCEVFFIFACVKCLFVCEQSNVGEAWWEKCKNWFQLAANIKRPERYIWTYFRMFLEYGLLSYVVIVFFPLNLFIHVNKLIFLSYIEVNIDLTEEHDINPLHVFSILKNILTIW